MNQDRMHGLQQELTSGALMQVSLGQSKVLRQWFQKRWSWST